MFTEFAFAYLDPGSGSFILQILAAGLLAALFTIKTWWYRVKNIFLKMMGKEPVVLPSKDEDLDDDISAETDSKADDSKT